MKQFFVHMNNEVCAHSLWCKLPSYMFQFNMLSCQIIYSSARHSFKIPLSVLRLVHSHWVRNTPSICAVAYSVLLASHNVYTSSVICQLTFKKKKINSSQHLWKSYITSTQFTVFVYNLFTHWWRYIKLFIQSLKRHIRKVIFAQFRFWLWKFKSICWFSVLPLFFGVVCFKIKKKVIIIWCSNFI